MISQGDMSGANRYCRRAKRVGQPDTQTLATKGGFNYHPNGLVGESGFRRRGQKLERGIIGGCPDTHPMAVGFDALRRRDFVKRKAKEEEHEDWGGVFFHENVNLFLIETWRALAKSVTPAGAFITRWLG